MVDIRKEDDIERLREVAVLQDAEIGLLHERLSAMSREIEKLREEKQGRLQQELQAVKAHLAKLQKIQFGASSEKRKRDEADQKPKKRKGRSRSGPRPQPHLEREEAWFKLDDADRICPGCGDPLCEMGELAEESELIDVVERKFVVKQVKRQKYTCRGCGHIEAALGPDKLRGTRRYSPDFAIEVATNKYLDHLPLARQVRIMERQGLLIDTQTLWDQLDALAEHVETTYLGIKHWIFGADVVGMDETTWRLMETGATKKWQMWAIRGRGAMWFALRDSRSGETAAELLDSYSGWLITDGCPSYDKAARLVPGEVRLSGCWAHVRRKFVDAESNDPERAEAALNLIGKLYDVEKKARDPDEGIALMDWRRDLRETESKSILKELKTWAFNQRVLPKSAIGKAIAYMMERWERLELYIEHPELWIDNNPTERGIRGPVVGRKNHYGSRSRRGTEVAAQLYTIFETAKICGVDPREYLKRVVMNDIRSPNTVTLPAPIEAVLSSLDD
ncbi:IS66 family transposase [Bradymonadales bacterium TMQ1]|nr:IS66 family transposase [Bradymonadales bacterium TMQ1]